ncbi:MAG: MmcQ/YjbR family DNA-binding protein [Solirubrobacterales bacterium]
MITPQQTREIALGLPETSEDPHFERTAFKVKGKIFATMAIKDETLHLRLTPGHVATMTQVDPKAYEKVQWGKTDNWLRAVLTHADPADVEDLLIDAWYERAPARLAASVDLKSSR